MKGNFRAQARRGDRGDGEAEPGPGHAIFAAAKESLADTGKVYFVHAGAFIGHDKPVNGGVKTGHGAEQKSATAAPV